MNRPSRPNWLARLLRRFRPAPRLDELEPPGPLRDLIQAIRSQVGPDQRRELQAELIEHLERAQAVTDRLGLNETGYLVERALDDARAVHWPHIDPNVEAFRQPPKNR